MIKISKVIKKTIISKIKLPHLGEEVTYVEQFNDGRHSVCQDLIHELNSKHKTESMMWIIFDPDEWRKLKEVE